MTDLPPVAAPIRASQHALKARESIVEHAVGLGVDEAFIGRLVEAFYARVRSDRTLAPIFADRVEDWPEHMEQMKRFWRSILHNSGEFSGSPMAKHIALSGLDEPLFNRWLELFYATLNDLLDDRDAIELVAKRARSIAQSLSSAIALRRGGINALYSGKDLIHV